MSEYASILAILFLGTAILMSLYALLAMFIVGPRSVLYTIVWLLILAVAGMQLLDIISS